jgi:hypothetical protein
MKMGQNFRFLTGGVRAKFGIGFNNCFLIKNIFKIILKFAFEILTKSHQNEF